MEHPDYADTSHQFVQLNHEYDCISTQGRLRAIQLENEPLAKTGGQLRHAMTEAVRFGRRRYPPPHDLPTDTMKAILGYVLSSWREKPTLCTRLHRSLSVLAFHRSASVLREGNTLCCIIDTLTQLLYPL